MQNIISNYISENKVLAAKEVIPPSLENEYSCAFNFNKETVNSVLNFAQNSKVKLMNSLSANTLIKSPT